MALCPYDRIQLNYARWKKLNEKSIYCMIPFIKFHKMLTGEIVCQLNLNKAFYKISCTNGFTDVKVWTMKSWMCFIKSPPNKMSTKKALQGKRQLVVEAITRFNFLLLRNVTQISYITQALQMPMMTCLPVTWSPSPLLTPPHVLCSGYSALFSQPGSHKLLAHSSSWYSSPPPWTTLPRDSLSMAQSFSSHVSASIREVLPNPLPKV